MGGGSYKGGGSYAGSRYGLTTNQEYGYTKLSDYSNEDEKTKVFISYHTVDVAQARLLGYQLEDPRYNIDMEDNSPKNRYPGNWTIPMTTTIGDSDVVIVAVGQDTHERGAVKWEIQTANDMGKPVYAVRLYDDEHHKIPPEVYAGGGKVLPWDLQRIKYEINKTT